MSAMALEGFGEGIGAEQRRTVPFDIAFRFTLTGEREKTHRTVATISIEATFVALSIGYGLEPGGSSSVIFGPPPQIVVRALPFNLRNLTMGDVIDGLAIALNEPSRGAVGPRVAAALENGFKLNSAFATLALAGASGGTIDQRTATRIFQSVAAPVDRIQFRYALFDDATGREFQSEPILNIAGLGSADGDRPFRYFAQPIIFQPRSTIRLEITELTTFKGELYVSLQGYKALGGAGSPTQRAVQRASRRAGRTSGTRRR